MPSSPLPAPRRPAADRPVVLLPACNRMLGDHPFHIVGRKYVEAVRLAGALPLVVPRAEPAELDALLALADGVLLTGSPSNVHPGRFGEAVHDPALPLDPERDDWVLALLPHILARGLPLLAICRGAQELNVALGGTLHQAVHVVAPYADHRADDGSPAELQYGAAHAMQPVPGGLLAAIVGSAPFDVNSLHGQAIARLADGLRAEGHAPDDLVEAFTQPDAPGFNLALQWHPEWRAHDNPESRKLFAAFGQAVRQYRARVRGGYPHARVEPAAAAADAATGAA
ncbi:MAG: gamma-glutamyl-gamma-aminobutyrate hydrolase family protein [Rubrivivax sp.]